MIPILENLDLTSIMLNVAKGGLALIILGVIGFFAYKIHRNRQYFIDVTYLDRRKGHHALGWDKARIVTDEKTNDKYMEYLNTKLTSDDYSDYFIPSADGKTSCFICEKVGNLLVPRTVTYDESQKIEINDRAHKKTVTINVGKKLLQVSLLLDRLNSFYQRERRRSFEKYVVNQKAQFVQNMVLFGAAGIFCLVIIVLSTKFSSDMIGQGIDSLNNMLQQIKPITEAILANTKAAEGVQVVQ